MKKYDVVEAHLGDKPEPYQPGDTRELSHADADPLVKLGLLKEAELDEPHDELDPEAEAARARANGWVSVETHDALVVSHKRLADELAEANAKRDEAVQREAAMREEIEQIKGEIVELQKSLDGAAADLVTANDRAAEAEKKVGELTQQLADKPAATAK